MILCLKDNGLFNKRQARLSRIITDAGLDYPGSSSLPPVYYPKFMKKDKGLSRMAARPRASGLPAVEKPHSERFGRTEILHLPLIDLGATVEALCGPRA
jgi:hypothetical protein